MANAKRPFLYMKMRFSTKCDSVEYMCEAEPEKGILHAEMHIHGQRVMLNDHGGSEALTANSTVHLVVVFANESG